MLFRDSKTPHRHTYERVCYRVETFPPSCLPPQDGSLSLNLLSLFSSFIFCSTSFWRDWTAFLDAWCPPSVSKSYFVEVDEHSNDLLVKLYGSRWSYYSAILGPFLCFLLCLFSLVTYENMGHFHIIFRNIFFSNLYFSYSSSVPITYISNHLLSKRSLSFIYVTQTFWPWCCCLERYFVCVCPIYLSIYLSIYIYIYIYIFTDII